MRKPERLKTRLRLTRQRKRTAAWVLCGSIPLLPAPPGPSGNFSGVHFHWLMPEVDQGEIGRIASSGGEEGETPSAGTTVSAAGPRSFADSGCEADTGETYDRFIALKYSYAITEDTAREGYTLHGNHRDDLPIEVITTDASENGANASFAGIYSHEIRVNDGAVAESARMVRDVRARQKKAGGPWN